jgi:putative peptide zinc metalloprotease protein
MPAATETPASDLERRKKVRLRVRPDLDINPQRYEGRTYYVVKDPVSLRYYRFKEQEHFLIHLMDGTHTLDDAQKEFEKRFRPDRLTLEDLEQFGQQLLTAGLAQNESPQAGKQLFDRRKKRTRSEWMQTLTNILYIKIPVFDPERLLEWMLHRLLPAVIRTEIVLFWTFSVLLFVRFMVPLGEAAIGGWELLDEQGKLPLSVTWFWVAWAVLRILLKTVGFFKLTFILMAYALLMVLTNWQTFYDRLPAQHEFFSFKNVAYMWVALGVVKVIHEFGHGLSCKAFGGEVHEMGFLFLCFSPCMYCNVSDAWTLPNKWKRIIISGAGIYVELLIAAIATLYWFNSPSGTVSNSLAQSLMVVCSVSTIVFNGNPLMRYDGYYVLADWLEIPNLRDRANRYLQRLVMEHCLGIEVQPEPYMELHRRWLFLIYAVVSWVYRWVVTFTILKFMSTFLKPYKLEVISTMLAVAAAASMVGWPLWRLGKNIHKRGRLPDMKPVRVTLSAIAVAGVILAFFFLPISYVSRVRQTGLVELQPGAAEKVPVLLPGEPVKVLVQEGQFVRKGAELAVFKSTALTKKEIALQAQLQEQIKLLESYQVAMGETKVKEDTDQLLARISEAEIKKKQVEVDLGSLAQQKKLLVLKAPRDGVVMGLPSKDELYRPWEKSELDKPFCHIGDPKKLRILVPVAPDDYELIRTDLLAAQKRHQKVEVTLRIHGFAGQTWDGRVATPLPQATEKTVPVQLTTKGGGPLATKPGSDPRNPEPQGQYYLIGIDFETQPDRAISPGTLGQVKIHCEPRSLAWYSWHWLSSTFDLGLW